MKPLAERRVLVVGASSGIGGAIATALGEDGARVAIAARRVEKLENIAAEVPGGASVIECDVRDPASCESAVERAAEALGGLDALIYAVGVAWLTPVDEADAAAWSEVFESNVIGASLCTRAALPHLQASRGRALYISSISADDNPPRPGLGLYLVSKTALNRMIDVWQSEHHEIGFTRVSVGDTGATDFAADWDMEHGSNYVTDWVAKGYMFGRAMLPSSVARHVAALLASEEAVTESRLVPRFAEAMETEGA